MSTVISCHEDLNEHRILWLAQFLYYNFLINKRRLEDMQK